VKKNKKSFDPGPLSDAYLSTVMASMVRTEVWETASSMKGTRWHMAFPISHMSWIREKNTIKKCLKIRENMAYVMRNRDKTAICTIGTEISQQYAQ
jgi:hypothetical protein